MDLTASQTTRLVAITADLIFASKITGTASALGVSAMSVRSVNELTAKLENNTVQLVLVDMSLPEELAKNAIHSAAAREPRPAIVAFYSHVHASQAQAAHAAGATSVLPRSTFSVELPAIIQNYCQS